MQIEFEVNGDRRVADVEERTSLLDVLRETFGLHGTHVGCEQGVCGCCNVLVDDTLVRSCLMFGFQADGAKVTTVEGVEGEQGELTPLQESFCQHHAMQCGYCTPGMIMTFTALLEENPTPDSDQIREALSGNLCRCTGYQQILEAVESHVASTGAATGGAVDA